MTLTLPQKHSIPKKRNDVKKVKNPNSFDFKHILSMSRNYLGTPPRPFQSLRVHF